MVGQLAPAYNTLARVITGLPKWTQLQFHLQEARMAPLDLLLDLASQRYGVRIILSLDDHPCQNKLLEFINTPAQPTKSVTGLNQIAQLLLELLGPNTKMENPGHQQLDPMEYPEIAQSSKEEEVGRHKTWACGISRDSILPYTDGSKGTDRTTSSAWHCVKGPQGTQLFQGHCQIGNKAAIKDRETHAIQEGLRRLVTSGTVDSEITLCADNPNALRALAGGPSAGREYIKACLEYVKI